MEPDPMVGRVALIVFSEESPEGRRRDRRREPRGVTRVTLDSVSPGEGDSRKITGSGTSLSFGYRTFGTGIGEETDVDV